jgi:hypothetical protein
LPPASKVAAKVSHNHVINLIRLKQKNGQAIRNKEILSFTTLDKMMPRSIGLVWVAEQNTCFRGIDGQS